MSPALRLALGAWLATLPTLLCGLTLAPRAAHAQHRPPPVLPSPHGEAPLPEPEEMLRRQLELSVTPLLSLLRCNGQAPSTLTEADPCARLSHASGVGLSLHYRPTPRLAIGAQGELSRFDWQPSRSLGEGAESQGARWLSVGLSARAYLFDEGKLDPYVGFAGGMAFLSMRGSIAGAEAKLWREGLLAEARLGLDVWLSSRLKLGPSAGLLWQPTGAVELCSSEGCVSAAALARIPDHAWRIGATLTLVAGDEL